MPLRPVFIVEQGAGIFKSGEAIVVRKGNAVLRKIPVHQFNQLVLMGNVSLSPQSRGFLLDRGIDVVFTTIHGRFRGRLVSEIGKNVNLRIAQFKNLDNPEIIIKLAGAFIRGKLTNCRILLRRYNNSIKSEQISSCIARLRAVTRRLQNAGSIDSLRGLEGAGASEYFRGLGNLVKAVNFSFEKRTRRPPRDPFNALLSFGYMLLTNTVRGYVNRVGLDPYLGALHRPDYGRPSLVLDIIEEFRPVIVDTVVLRAVNKRVITLRDFEFQPEAMVPEDPEEEMENPTPDDMPVLMNHKGIKKLILQFQNRLQSRLYISQVGKKLTYETIIMNQIYKLAGVLEEPDKEYEPFIYPG